MKKILLAVVSVAIGIGISAYLGLQIKPHKKRMVCARGFVRGKNMYGMCNKYAGFVSKVNFYSHQPVKKGDVIVEYDDHNIREQILLKQNAISEQQKIVAQKWYQFSLTKMDPLPSEYRNLAQKKEAAKARYEHLKHEAEVYKSLHEGMTVSQLALNEKEKDYQEAAAEYERYQNDMQVLKKGLSKRYIEAEMMGYLAAKVKLENLRKELKVLEEEQKYYKIVAPIDGITVTNSDTVTEYDAVGTTAAYVHRADKKIIYAYVPAADAHYFTENEKYRFRSFQYGEKGGYYPVTLYEIKRKIHTYGNQNFYQLRLTIDAEPQPLRLESLGQVELEVTE